MHAAPIKGTLEVLAGPAKPRSPQLFPVTKTAFAVSGGKRQKEYTLLLQSGKVFGELWCLFLPSRVATQLKEIFDLQTHTLTGERTIC